MKDCYSAELAVCPFFRNNDAMTIHCEGPMPSSTVAVRFHNAKDKTAYRARYCNTFGYGLCPYSTAARRKYDE